MKLFAMIVFVMFSISNSYAKEGFQSRVEISYVQWNLLVRQALTPADVRRMSFVSVRINDAGEILKFMNALKLEKLNASFDGGIKKEDARLVIDIYNENEDKITYYASAFNLITEDGSKWMPIDEKFKSRFFNFSSPG